MQKELTKFIQNHYGLLMQAVKEDKEEGFFSLALDNAFYKIKEKYNILLRKYFSVFPKFESIVILQNQFIYTKNQQGIDDCQYLIDNFYLYKHATREKNSLGFVG